MGEPTLRKKVAGGTSPYDDLTLELAAALIRAPHQAPTTASPALVRRRLLVGAAIVALVGLVALVLMQLSGGDNPTSSPEPAEASATSTVPTGTEVSPTVSEPAAALVELEPRPCPFNVGEPAAVEDGSDARAATFIETFEANGGEAALGCAVEAVTERGGLYWQELRLEMRARGGLLGLPDGRVLYLNAGQWRSYIRIGGGDGTLSPTWGGLPTGEVAETEDGWSLELDSEVELVSTAIDGSYWWLPGTAASMWSAAGRSGGEYGDVASNPYRVAEGVRQDFANGYLLLDTAGALAWNALGDPSSELPPPEELRGRIVTAIDGTGWLIDDELRRWWIVDIEHWYCAGADKNAVDQPVSGSAVATLQYGGVLDCPAAQSGVNPRGGTTSRKVYCESAVQTGATERPFEGGYGCTDGVNTVPIDLDDLCTWQYGPGAIGVLAPSDPSSWRCEAARSE
ncbi:MAG: hypothetical protein DHS20C19_14310 [Acidimicrobiales bacterium]|nr:MAG: hypothetical protein DHS20C19_14310 [Acidimicrobiales bacterium]